MPDHFGINTRNPKRKLSYFRGGYIKQSLAEVGSKDASYAYVQLTLKL